MQILELTSLPEIYGEIPQVNPLRWEILYYSVKDKTYSVQTRKFRCTDFLNDVVAAKHKTFFKKYGFDNKLKYNRNGVWFRLTYLKPHFVHNIMTAINPRLQQDLGCSCRIKSLDDTSCLLFIPKQVWTATYYISLLSWCIRLCNYGGCEVSWKSLMNSHAITSRDTKRKHSCPEVELMGFSLPEKLQGYWWYRSPTDNSKTPSPYDIAHYIHNNGCIEVTQAIQFY